MKRKLALESLAFVALAVLVAVLPRLVSDFHARELAYVGVDFIALIGLALLTGFSGQISLGHGAFMAIGGYTTAILSVDHGVRDIWTIPTAAAVAGAAGLAVGVPAVRLSGPYLALVTFGIAVSLPQLLKKYEHFTGGTTGKVLIASTPFGLNLTTNDWLYYLTWGIALVLLAAAWVLLRTRPGRTWQAIRDSELAATASGISIPTFKTLAFGISAAYAGVAGSLYAIATSYVNPDVYPVSLSIFLVAGLAVGGLGALAGLIGGAALVYYLQYHADAVARWADHVPFVSVDPSRPGIPSVVFGAVLILAMLALPFGAGGVLQRVLRPLTRRLYSRS